MEKLPYANDEWADAAANHVMSCLGETDIIDFHQKHSWVNQVCDKVRHRIDQTELQKQF
jgi:hypothetical protein